MPYKNVCRKKPPTEPLSAEQLQHQAEMRIRQADRNKETAAKWREARLKRDEEKAEEKKDAAKREKSLQAITEQQLRLQALQLQTSETSASSEPQTSEKSASSEPTPGSSRLDISQESVDSPSEDSSVSNA